MTTAETKFILSITGGILGGVVLFSVLSARAAAKARQEAQAKIIESKTGAQVQELPGRFGTPAPRVQNFSAAINYY